MARCRVLCSSCLCSCVLCCVVALACVPAARPRPRRRCRRLGPSGRRRGLVRAFDPPQSRYGAGHLGVDFARAAGHAGPGRRPGRGDVRRLGRRHAARRRRARRRPAHVVLVPRDRSRCAAGRRVRAGDVLGTTRRHRRRTTTAACSTSACASATTTSTRCCCSAPSTSRRSCTSPRPTSPFGYTVAEERRGLLAGLATAVGDGVGAAVGRRRRGDRLAPDVDAIAAALPPAADLVARWAAATRSGSGACSPAPADRRCSAASARPDPVRTSSSARTATTTRRRPTAPAARATA